MSDQSEFARALGNLEGTIKATQISNNEKFTVLFQKIADSEAEKVKMMKRITTLEFDKKLVIKLASVVSFFATGLWTGIIWIGSRLITAKFG